MGIEVLDGGWKSWIFIDADPSGSKIITTPHMDGPLLVHSFPSLEIVRSIEPPPGQSWIERAFFAGKMIVGGLARGRTASLPSANGSCWSAWCRRPGSRDPGG
jgi:hypothetical protein